LLCVFPASMLLNEFLDLLFFISVKNDIEILMKNALNLQIAFDSVIIFRILFLPIQVHGSSFHRLMFSSVSFCSALIFCVENFQVLN
jgi:hypothetical protein